VDFGAAVRGGGEQFERAAAVGLGATVTVGLGHGVAAVAVVGAGGRQDTTPSPLEGCWYAKSSADATEPNLAFHRDIDPVRMMRTRFADPIRASSPPGLHQQAGHMTASDLCAARQMISCQAGAIHT
jgi:hypothetical protein